MEAASAKNKKHKTTAEDGSAMEGAAPKVARIAEDCSAMEAEGTPAQKQEAQEQPKTTDREHRRTRPKPQAQPLKSFLDPLRHTL